MTRTELIKAVRGNPRDGAAWLALGHAFLQEGERDKGRECFERVLSLDPSNGEARLALASLEAPAEPELPDWWDEPTPTPAIEPTPPPRPAAPPIAVPILAPEPPPLASRLASWQKAPAIEVTPASAISASPAPAWRPVLPPAAPQPEVVKEPKAPRPPKGDPSSGLLRELREVLPLLGAGLLVLLAMLGGMYWWTNRPQVDRFIENANLQRQPVITLERPAWLVEAEVLRWSNQLTEAESALRAAAARPEDEALAQAALSLLLTDQLGRADEAVAAAERAVELASAPAHKGYAAYALIMALESQRQPTDGARLRAIANAARAAAPRYAYTQMARARAEAANAAWREAMNAARDAVHTAGEADAPEAWIALARAAVEQGDYIIAEEAFGKALAGRDYGPWQVDRALLLAQLGRPDEASIILAHGRSLAPELPNATFAEAYLALLRRDTGGTEAALARLDEQLPERGYDDLLRGALAMQQGQWTEAIDAYRLAARDASLEVTARAGVANAYSSSGDCTRGAEEAEQLRKLASAAAESLLAQARARLCQGQPDSALALMRRGIEYNPANFNFYHMAAIAATQGGQTELAIDFFVQALQYAPTLTGIHPSISDLYLQSGDPLAGLRARFHAEIALELDPPGAAGHSAMGRLLAAIRRPLQAIEAFEAARATAPLNTSTKLNYVEALLAAGNTQGAVAVLEGMAGSAERSPLVLYALARAYRDQGRYGDARDLMGEFLGLVGDAQLSTGLTAFADALFDPNGYLIPRTEIAGVVQSYLSQGLQREDATVSIVPEADGEWLTLTVPTAEALGDEEQVGTASLVMVVSAIPYARFSPALAGGVQVRVVGPDGALRFALRVPAAIAREYSDGLIDEMYLLSSAAIQRDTSGDEPMTEERALRIGRDMAEARHLPLLEEVPFNLIPRDALAERFAHDSSDARTQEAMRSAEALYKLLGLLGPEESLAAIQQAGSVEGVLGFYEPDEGAFYLVTDEGTSDSVQDEITVAHEYQHAIQDQHFGLERFREAEDSDQQRAFQALAEGEATYSSYEYAYGTMPLFNLLSAFSSAARVDEERLEASPRYVRSTILFPYETGYAFVAAMVQQPDGSTDWDRVNELFENPPRSTEQVIHPDKYEEQEPPLATALPHFAPLGEAWSVQTEDVLGELSLNLLIEPFTGHAIASRASDGWGGDRYAILEGPNAQQALVLRLRWDSEAEAQEFWSLWPLYLRHRPAFRRLVDDPLADVYAITRWWQGPEQVIFVQREDATTITVAVGPSRDTLQPFADSLPGAVRERQMRGEPSP